MKTSHCSFALFFLAATLAAGCGGEEASSSSEPLPSLETRADSLAMQIYEAHGGPQMWRDMPALAFTFAVGQDSSSGTATRQEVARHWWRRSDGAYRVEWSEGADSTYAAVFNARAFSQASPSGRAMLNGARLDSAAEQDILRQAYRRFTNDTYWLLAPLKLFDEGVNRSIATSSPAGEDSLQAPEPQEGAGATQQGGEGDLLHLSFDRVGLTPKDQYWLAADSTGRLSRWTFVLQGMGPDQPPGVFRWVGYQTFSTPAGPLTLSTRKESVGGSRVIYTDEVRTPAQLPDSLFSIGEG